MTHWSSDWLTVVISKNPSSPKIDRDPKIKKRKGKQRYQGDSRRKPVNKNEEKKRFFTKTSDNHTSENHATGVFIPIYSHMIRVHILLLSLYISRVINWKDLRKGNNRIKTPGLIWLPALGPSESRNIFMHICLGGLLDLMYVSGKIEWKSSSHSRTCNWYDLRQWHSLML